jgi:hypothetical protein
MPSFSTLPFQPLQLSIHQLQSIIFCFRFSTIARQHIFQFMSYNPQTTKVIAFLFQILSVLSGSLYVEDWFINFGSVTYCFLGTDFFFQKVHLLGMLDQQTIKYDLVLLSLLGNGLLFYQCSFLCMFQL